MNKIINSQKIILYTVPLKVFESFCDIQPEKVTREFVVWFQ